MTSHRTETQRIAEQLVRLYLGPSWLGPSIQTLLSDVDGESAARRPLATAHTIWELVLHVTTWLRIARERLSATTPRDATPEEDWPAMEGSWESALRLLEEEVSAFEEAILQFADSRLEMPAPAQEPQSYYALLHGVIQHCAYHAGQIAVLKKAP